MSEVSGYGKKGFFTEENSKQIQKIASKYTAYSGVELSHKKNEENTFQDDYGNEYVLRDPLIPTQDNSDLLLLKKVNQWDMIPDLLNIKFTIHTQEAPFVVKGISSGCFSNLQMKETETLKLYGIDLQYIEPFSFENFNGNIWISLDQINEVNYLLLSLVFYGSQGNLTLYSPSESIEYMEKTVVDLGVAEKKEGNLIIKGTSMKIFFEDNSQNLSLIPVYPFSMNSNTYYLDRNGNYYSINGDSSMLLSTFSSYPITRMMENCKVQLPDGTEKKIESIYLENPLCTSVVVKFLKIPSSIKSIVMKQGTVIGTLDITAMNLTVSSFTTNSFNQCIGSLKLTNAQMDFLTENGFVDTTGVRHFINSTDVLFEIVEEEET